MKVLKCFSILILPIVIYISFTSKAWLTFAAPIVFYGFVPMLEFFLKVNFTKHEEKAEKNNKLYTYLLYGTIPIQIIFLFFFLNTINTPNLSTLEISGRIFSMGIMTTIIGINVGHELGHRNNKLDEFLGGLLLLSILNTHFLPYHNGGHHYNAATPNDAATAKKGEILYFFWIRSYFQSYYQAWGIENTRMKNERRNWFHFHNKMVMYSLCNIVFLASIFYFFGQFALIAFIIASVINIAQLETVNYIEHHGLLRKKNEHGRYEKVKRIHSWNSNYQVGQILLFNLSRHSDHHFNGSKHYQLLKTVPESPQMPIGYLGMMMLSFLPPLWFLVMNKRIQKIS
jgi:alkane 1-monooxygenase